MEPPEQRTEDIGSKQREKHEGLDKALSKGSMEKYFLAVKSPARKALPTGIESLDAESHKLKQSDIHKSSTSVEAVQEEKNQGLHMKDKSLLIVNEETALTKAKPKEKELQTKKKRQGKTAKVVKKKDDDNLARIPPGDAKPMTQSIITQHFPVRRSNRRTMSKVIQDEYELRVKRVQSADEEGLEVRTLPDKGRGVFASRPFAKGELVCEYAGDLISLKEAKEREEEYSKNREYGCYMYYFSYKGKKYCVDATKESTRLGRLLNHSKTSSNVLTELMAINNTPHLLLVANRDVEIGEELLYDYGDRSKDSIASHPWLKL